ncbi:uridine kinase [Plectosphaerella plurivora]|uniref:uridine/cytidine kinase n=1 Tax=Plectosphaerella plurivora TaxID=936078 RepID=A0A9P8V2G5_9PEZI|nr:uridine kinase [Plectosphaerella plurivora]
MASDESHVTVQKRLHYSPPWADVSIIGIAGSSGSGKSTLAHAICAKLNLPWVVILSMDSFYNPLTPAESKKAFANEFDFDAPDAIDFDVLVECLRDLKAGKRAEIPVYSFAKHQRLDHSTTIYSPHVLILEGIFALHDPRILDLLDMRIFCEADADTCLSRRVLRDVRDRGRDVEGIMKQWFGFVKPNFEKAINFPPPPPATPSLTSKAMVVQYIERKLLEKSTHHRAALTQLEVEAATHPLSNQVVLLEQTPQLKGMNTILQDIDTSSEDFIFYFDRLASLLIEQALNNVRFSGKTIQTPAGYKYNGLTPDGEVTAVLVLRGGAAFETALHRLIPDCRTGRILIQSDVRTGEPALHYLKLPQKLEDSESVLLIDTQMASGGAALMAVQVLVDHGVAQEKIVLACYHAGKLGVHRLSKVFPGVTVVLCNMLADIESRWVEKRYFRC